MVYLTSAVKKFVEIFPFKKKHAVFNNGENHKPSSFFQKVKS